MVTCFGGRIDIDSLSYNRYGRRVENPGVMDIDNGEVVGLR